MTVEQKIIKSVAIALAVLIISSMVTGIVGIFNWIVGFGDSLVGENQLYTPEGEIKSLKIEVNVADFAIVNGDAFRVESNLKRLDVGVKNGRLTLIDKSHGNSNDYKDASILLVVPVGFMFTEVDIDIAAGKITVEKINAELFDMELGATEAVINCFSVTKSAEIQGGAGNISILDGSIRNLNVEMGIGVLNLKSKLLGIGTLDLGVGEVNITLLGGKDSYTSELNRALGAITYDGQSIQDSRTIGNGENKVRVNGGIGRINIAFE